MNRRMATGILLAIVVVALVAIAIAGPLVTEQAMATDFARKDLPPSWQHPFGTDWMGRDMFLRTIAGLSTSLRLGMLTASLSAGIALLLGSLAATFGRLLDATVSWLIDLAMGIPHLLLLILIALAVGKGAAGIIIGVMVTHWMALARVMRAEVLQLKQSGYVLASEKLGVGKLTIIRKHMLPHLLPQLLVGLVLLFPHVILHEASLTFLGFGLSPEQPAIGIILSESMRYLVAGTWWLAVFPGLMLVAVVAMFSWLGGSLRKLLDPVSIHE
ncbi:MAG: ABC transporter permease [Coriobacteriia bacterium]|nr:ABC transporter permease [Coriobacteriia bacterium]